MIDFESSVVVVFGLSRLSSPCRASTVTVCELDDTCNVKFRETVRPTGTTVGRDLCAAKPSAFTETSYVPGLICKKRNAPCAFVCAFRVALVSISTAETVAAGMTAPLLSLTTPERALEVPLCANRPVVEGSTQNVANSTSPDNRRAAPQWLIHKLVIANLLYIATLN